MKKDNFQTNTLPVFDVILGGGTLVNHEGISQRDIGIINDQIAYIGTLHKSQAGKFIDCKGLHILPGIIDTHVHFREPGLMHKETLETGSKAAVLGGVTSIFEMPNTTPLTIYEENLADKVSRAHHKMHCDFAFWIGATRDTIKDIQNLENLPGSAGIKVFMGSSTGDLLVDDDESVRAILKQTKKRVAFHSEDEERLNERKNLQIPNDPSSHSVWRDEIAAIKNTERLVKIARECNAKIHILHVSTANEISFLKDHKDLVTLEVTPHHLTLDITDYERLGALIQMNPPIRDKAHREALWYGLEQGIIDILGSDHAPHHLEEKSKPYPQSPSGIIGVQTSTALMLNYVHQRRLTLERFVDMTSYNVARIFQLKRKGRVAVGYDADFTIVDLSKEKIISNEDIASLPKWTPYEGQVVKGWPIGTIIRGKQVMWNGEILTPSQGEAVKFLE